MIIIISYWSAVVAYSLTFIDSCSCPIDKDVQGNIKSVWSSIISDNLINMAVVIRILRFPDFFDGSVAELFRILEMQLEQVRTLYINIVKDINFKIFDQ